MSEGDFKEIFTSDLGEFANQLILSFFFKFNDDLEE